MNKYKGHFELAIETDINKASRDKPVLPKFKQGFHLFL